MFSHLSAPVDTDIFSEISRLELIPYSRSMAHVGLDQLHSVQSSDHGERVYHIHTLKKKHFWIARLNKEYKLYGANH